MSKSRAWTAYQASRTEVSELLAAAEGANATIMPGHRMSQRELILRAAAVALVGGYHNYLEELIEEWTDGLGSDFQKLPPIGRRYVVLQVEGRLREGLLDRLDQAGEMSAQKRMIQAVEECSDWIRDPSTLGVSAKRPRIEGFLRDQGANAVDRTLTQLRDDGTKFFSWLQAQHPAYADYFVRLNSVIELRNNVAHGRLTTRVTLADFKRHRATITVLVRKSEHFVASAFAGTTAGAART